MDGGGGLEDGGCGLADAGRTLEVIALKIQMEDGGRQYCARRLRVPRECLASTLRGPRADLASTSRVPCGYLAGTSRLPPRGSVLSYTACLHQVCAMLTLHHADLTARYFTPTARPLWCLLHKYRSGRLPLA